MIENASCPEDAQLLKQALTSGRIVIAQNGALAVGGNATGNIIIIGDNTKFPLSAEALKMLRSADQPPRLLLSGEQAAGSTIPDMSEEARKILEEVSRSHFGRIMRPGWGIQIDNRPIYYANLRARERAALEGLLTN